ncbi:hypothetical protein Pmar_PMAR027585 [Perkinsus marinus ATCC 50983]|uniref:Uncharacterized protein n=1 Tax=Perkinsus marinus (strain ATCC 50983 / TXsc) TaxID=423536 RepID=C5KC57_PERM5|nr:hypothetical protein Pmar_PMAR027585 [Perkinsus marinus ATCC 50983]EER17870.1 hypothetical protein Pmar_PMAR027585 [Perkinsus marinus ATCC 50983]|eukprot:XP_002786074.1 hypothetical protein Pmar_PMAR027585 [Perkinsus marinus ATCC 50983]
MPSPHTKKRQELLRVREDLDTAFETEDLTAQEQLQERECQLESDISHYRDLINTCTAKIDHLLADASVGAQALLPAPSPGLPVAIHDESVNSLVTVLADALAKATSSVKSNPSSMGSRPMQLSDVSKLSVSSRTLKDVSLLSVHYRRMESLFVAANFGQVGEDGRFTPHESIKVAVIEKFLDTLSPFATLVNEAARNIDSNGHNWVALRETLLDKFCSPGAIRKEVRKRVGKLTFPGAANVDQYIDQLRDIRTLHLGANHKCTTLSSTGACQCFDDNTHFIDSVLKPVPRDLKVQLARDVISAARHQYSERRTLDWQLRLPFDGTSGTVTILSLLADVCCANSLTTEGGLSRKHEGQQPSSDVREKLWHASDRQPHSTVRTAAQKAHAEAVEWARTQPFVLLVMGEGVKSATASTTGFSAAKDLRFLTSRAGKPYCLMSFPDKSSAMACVSDHFADKSRFGIVKEFDTDYKRRQRGNNGGPKNEYRSGGQ